MTSRPLSHLGAAVLAASVPLAADAALGGMRSSIAQEQAKFHAQLRTQARGSATLHELTLPNGTIVKQLSNAQGQIYALSWHGPGKPDLRSLLGAHFGTFQTDNAQPNGRFIRRPMMVWRGDLIIQTGGHPGAFWGIAYLPQLTPAGFSADTAF